LGVPVTTLDADHFFSVRYNFRLTDYFQDPEEPETGPADLTPQYPRQGNFSSVRLSYSVSNTERYADSVSAEKGYSLSGSLSLRDPATGADFRSVTGSYTVVTFLPMPWIDHHVLSLRATGAMTRSDYRIAQHAIGGIPPQQTITSLINETPLGGTYLRGFETGAFRGEQTQLFSAEYRFPVWYVEEGFDTLPWRIDTLDGAVFADLGGAFDGPLEDASLYPGVGFELRLRTTIGYTLPTNFRAGYAYGFGSQGVQQFYLFYGGVF
jgi:outer membrane protein assembly factor BamA